MAVTDIILPQWDWFSSRCKKISLYYSINNSVLCWKNFINCESSW